MKNDAKDGPASFRFDGDPSTAAAFERRASIRESELEIERAKSRAEND